MRSYCNLQRRIRSGIPANRRPAQPSTMFGAQHRQAGHRRPELQPRPRSQPKRHGPRQQPCQKSRPTTSAIRFWPSLPHSRFRSSRNRTDRDTSRKKEIAAIHIPFIPHSRPRSAPITLSHITLQHEIRTLFVCASQREVQDSACPGNFAGQPPKELVALGLALEEPLHGSNPPHDERASTRRATQHHVDRTPVREEV